MHVTTLFSELQLGAIFLPNRIVMAPMTRMRANADHAPTALDVEYYAQRASAGLIITARIAQGSALNPHDRSTFYGGGAHGYTDYPLLNTPRPTKRAP